MHLIFVSSSQMYFNKRFMFDTINSFLFLILILKIKWNLRSQLRGRS